ncbi:MAG: hypothetical protein ACMG6H_04730 [Acidobacteriota bacterium]
MKRDPRTIMLTLGRCLKLRCPACGKGWIVGRPFHVNEHCATCGVIFKREEGFFVGAIMANVLATEGTILIVYFASLFLISNEQTMLTILFIVGVTFPLFFYHHGWALWLGLDHLIEGLPRSVKK